jgi:hypothetical protein
MIVEFIRYKVSRLLLKTILRRKVFEVEMEKCVNPLGFSFGRHGWHYIIEYLREVDSNPAIPLKESILYRYHKLYQIQSMKELVATAGMKVSFAPGFFRFPWGNFKKGFNHTMSEKNKHKSRFCGPSSEGLIKEEAKNILKLKTSIVENGYNPLKYPNNFIGGVFLVRENGDYRFVVLQGNHRVSIMSYLGIKSFKARSLNNYQLHIYETDIGKWYYVKNGMCSKEDARKYFNAFFILNGWERSQAIDLQYSNNLQGHSFDEHI